MVVAHQLLELPELCQQEDLTNQMGHPVYHKVVSFLLISCYERRSIVTYLNYCITIVGFYRIHEIEKGGDKKGEESQKRRRPWPFHNGYSH